VAAALRKPLVLEVDAGDAVLTYSCTVRIVERALP